MASWLDQFRGQHVTIVTTVGSDERTDTGTLIHAEEGWMQVVKDNGEMILVPSAAVRQVRLLDLTQAVPGVEAGANTASYAHATSVR